MEFVPGRAITRGHDSGGAFRGARAIAIAIEVADIATKLLNQSGARRVVPGHHAAEHEKVHLAAGQAKIFETGATPALYLLDPVPALLDPLGGCAVAFSADGEDAAILVRRCRRRQA